jgi:7-cyano-7-deazaguanine reductase
MTKPVLGRPDSVPSLQIDTFPVDGALEKVIFESSELLAICPVTDGPDVYDITVTYTPATHCIETKSLKLYLQTFRDEGIFAEHLAPRIAGHLAAAVGTTVRVVLRQHVRGGIVTTVSAVAPS